MARIIKEIPLKEKQVVCKNCGRTIAYVNNDIIEFDAANYGGVPDGYIWIICPANDCQKNIILKSW